MRISAQNKTTRYTVYMYSTGTGGYMSRHRTKGANLSGHAMHNDCTHNCQVECQTTAALYSADGKKVHNTEMQNLQ